MTISPKEAEGSTRAPSAVAGVRIGRGRSDDLMRCNRSFGLHWPSAESYITDTLQTCLLLCYVQVCIVVNSEVKHGETGTSTNG